MAPETFDPFAGDELAPADLTAPAPATAPEVVDPFATATAPPAPVQPATPVIKAYTVVHHPAHGYGLVLAASEVPGLAGPKNAVVVGWFASVSAPLDTDQVTPISSS